MGFLTGKTAIITGGGRAVLSDGSCGSIGYGIATAYAKEGANLVITGRNVKKLEDAKEELERLYGIEVLPVQADVNAGADNQAAVQNVVKQAVDKFGRIDVLINNAQASASGVTLADHTTEQFDLAVYSGLYAVFYYMKACYPYLKETKDGYKVEKIICPRDGGYYRKDLDQLYGKDDVAVQKTLDMDVESGVVETLKEYVKQNQQKFVYYKAFGRDPQNLK